MFLPVCKADAEEAATGLLSASWTDGAARNLCYRQSAMPDRSKRSATRSRTKPTTRRADVAADSALLRLARAVADVGASDVPARLDAALEHLAAAYTQDTEVPGTLFETWLHRRRAGRLDKTRVLAVAWAREQVRVALQELLEDERGRGRVRTDMTSDALSWILLAGCEALAHEPPGAATERIQLLRALAERREGR